MSKEKPPKFFNGNEFVDLLTDKTAMPASNVQAPADQRTSGVNLDRVRTKLQALHRSQMKVVD